MKTVSCTVRAMLFSLFVSLMVISGTTLADTSIAMPTDLMAAKSQNFVATAGEFNHYPNSTVAVGGVVNLMSGAPSNAIILAGEAHLGGMLSHYVLASAGKINFNAVSQDKTVLLGGTINTSPNSHMKQGAVIIGGDVNLTGDIYQDVSIVGGKVFLSGNIHGNVSVVAGQLTVLPHTNILGKLNYVTAGEPKISHKAKIGGGTHHLSPSQLTAMQQKTGFDWSQLLLRIVQLLIAIIVINAICKRFPHRVADTLTSSFWKNLGMGLLFVFFGALALPLLIVTVIGAYLAMLWGAIYALFILIGYLYTAQSIGLCLMSVMKKDVNVWLTTLAAFIGLVILTLVNLIPVAGHWIFLVFIVLGVGAVVRVSLCRSCADNGACSA